MFGLDVGFERCCNHFEMDSHDYLWVSGGTAPRIVLSQLHSCLFGNGHGVLHREPTSFLPICWAVEHLLIYTDNEMPFIGPCVDGSTYKEHVIPGCFLPWVYQQKKVYYINLPTS